MKLAITDVEFPAETYRPFSECMPARALPLKVCSHGLTDPGRKRTGNEDQFLIARLSKALQAEQSSLPQPEVQYSAPQGYLFVVADGVGGQAAGGQASALAVNTVEAFLLDA